MLEQGLKQWLCGFGLRQSELAILLDVSPRTVNMWAVGDVALPGPVAGYLRLLEQLPSEKLSDEFDRLPGRKKFFDEGLYRFQYCSTAHGEMGSGRALCALRHGKIFGCDAWGGEIRGSYTFNPAVGSTKVDVVLKVPEGSMLITGRKVGDDGGSFEISALFERAEPEAKTTVKVAGIPVEVILTFLGPLPS